MIESYLTETVTAAGTESAGAARVDSRTRVVRNVAGEQVVSSARALLSVATTITHEHKVRVSGVDRAVLAVNLS